MKYAGEFGASQAGLSSFGHTDFSLLSHRGDAGAVTIPDAHLLFAGNYERYGNDLIISDQMHRVLVPNYFYGDKRPLLFSPEGAPLDAAIVDALTGHTQYAQAGGSPAGKVVGHIAKMTGSASIVRNGVTIDVQVGDAVYQSDLLQTGSSSTVGLVLVDGSAFNLSANARLMLNDLTFDASSASNSFITLVQGAVNFVAGQVAKTGDMKVATPAAVIGVRGTAVQLDIASADGRVDISVIDQRDGQVHAVDVFKCVPTGVTDPQTGATCSAGDRIGTVTSNGPSLSVTPTPSFDVVVQQNNKTPAQIAQEFNAFQATIETYNIQKQINPNLPQHTENGSGNNSNTGTRYASLGSTPPDPPATDSFADGKGLAVQALVTDLEIQAAETLPATGTVGSSVTVPPVSTPSTTAILDSPANLPLAPQVTARLAFDTGTSTDIIISNNATMSGTGLANTAVNFTVDGSPIPTTVMTDANGVWSFTPSGLADGVHTIVASQTDSFGNTGAASLSFTLDTTAPGGGTPNLEASDTGSSSGDNITAATTPIFLILLSPSVAAGDSVQLLLNGSPLAHPVRHVLTAADVSAGRVSLMVTAGDLGVDGNKEVTAQFSDAAGNSSVSSPLSFLLDTAAPLVSIASGGGLTNQATQILTGAADAAEAGAIVTIFDNAVPIASAVVQSTGSWSSTVTLSSGNNTLTAQVTDLAGNTGTSASVVFTLSSDPPVNAAPTATNLSTAETYTEDTPLNLVDIVVSDADSANVTATLTLSNPAAGSLNTATSGTVTSTYNAATGVWTASGAIADVNALLAGLTLTPAANFNGSFSIATSISDGVAPALTGSKAFTGIAVNAAPTATNLSTAETYTEDTPLNLVDIVVSDADSANVTATLTLSNPAAGSLNTATSGAVTSTYNASTGVWTASGAIADVNALLAGLTLTPAANFNGSFSIATSISDGVAPALTGSKAFTGIAVNDAPVATPVTLTAGTEDTAYTISATTLLAGVTDADGQALSITAVSVASGGGSIINNGNGTWSYTPAANTSGPVSFSYTASDGSLSSSSTASLTLNPVNDAPVATNLSTAETYTQNIPLNLVDIVVSDADSASVTATLTLSNPAAGSLNTATSGTVTSTYNAATGVWTASGAIADVNALLAGLTLTPAANFNGSFSIATSISDGVAPAITGSKAFTGIAVNAAPTATNLSTAETYTEDTPLNLVDIVVSDADSANVTATLTLSNPAAGSLNTATSGAVTSTYNASTGVWTASGAIADVNALLAGLTLTPAANFNGSFSIATSISDGVAPALTGSKAFTGIAVNDAPVATPVTLTAGTEDTAYTISATTLLAGVTDADGQALSITAVSVASGGGSIINNGNGTWSYTPAANTSGPVSFSYTASDGSLSSSSTASLTLNPVNDAPVATNLSTAETYTQNIPLNLVDIVVSDADSASVTATLTLSNPAAGSLNTATSGTVTSTYNAATGVWTASGAIADVNALLAGLTLTPAANFNGSFSIATSISDGVAPAITGSKAFTGIAVNAAPTATNLSTAETYTEDTPLNLVDIVVSDADSANVTATLTLSNPAAGSLNTATSGAVTSTYNASTGVWTASGAIADVNALLAGLTLTPAANFNGSFSIATSISDGVAPALTGSKAFTGIAVNDAPVATPVTLTAGTEDTAYTISATTLLAGVTDADGQALSITAVSVASGGGSIVNNGNGTWSYTPAANYTGPVSFSYTASDGSLSSSSTASLTLNPVNDAPLATNLSTAETYTQNIPLNLVDIVVSDADSASVTATLTLSNPAAGSLNTATSGTVTSTYNASTGVWTASGAIADVNALLAGLTLTPAANFNGSFSIATSISDGVAPAITGSKAFTGIAVNDAPVATPVALTAGTEDTAYTITATTLLTGVTDADGQALSITAVSVASGGGSIINNGNGTWSYTPAANTSGPISFSYTASDGSLSSSSTASLTLNPVNDAPVATPVTLTAGTEDTAYTITATTLLTGVTDVDGPTLSITAVSVASGGGSIVNNGNGTWSYTPAANYTGPVSFSYTASDGSLSSSSTASLTLNPVNDAPLATNLSTAETYTQNIPLNLVDIVVSDIDSANVTAMLTLSNPAAGSLNTATSGAVTSTYNAATGVWTASGAIADVNALLAGLTLTPAANFNGSFSIATSISDGVAPAITGSKAFTSTTITGDGDNNSLIGTANADTLRGLAGNDRLQGLGGNDVLDGGVGFDRAVYTDATSGVTVNLAAGTAFGAGVGTDSLVDIEGAVGSDFADTFNAAGFVGTTGLPGVAAGQSDFEGRGGDDLIIGQMNALGQAVTRINYLSATDEVTVDIAAGTADGDGSVGHDTFSNVATVWGSAFNDTFYGSDNASFTYETYEGRGGNDLIDGRGGYDLVTYNNDPATTSGIVVHLAAGTVIGDVTVGTDTIRNMEAARGTNFDDVFDATGYGLAGALNVSTTNGNFNDFGGAGGNDTIIGNGFTRLNYIAALAGVTVDLETSATGTTTAITVAGSATGTTEGTDTFTGVNAVQGSMFGDTLLGSSFSNTFTGLGGADFIDGRGGFDTASYNSLSTATSGVSVNMAAGTATGDASIGTDTLRNIEAIQGTMLADTYSAIGYGLAGAANVSTSNGNFNQFEGLGDDDTITGNGNTRIVFYNAAAGVTVNLTTNISQGTASGDLAGVGTDTFSGINSVAGSAFADSLTGSDNAANTAEDFAGRGGNDFIDGRGGFDRAYYSDDPTGAGIQIDLASGNVIGDAAIGSDTLRSVEGVRGTSFADVFVATNFGVSGLNVGNFGTFNEFEGMRGDDSITGNGNTRIAFYNALAGVTVDLDAGASYGTASGDAAGVGNDSFVGVNAVRGSNFADAIFGDGNANALEGRDGDDRLHGRGGSDTLTGGNGADTFIYADGGGADAVTDFGRAQGDLIDVSGVAIIASFADIQSRATVVNGNTLINFGGGNTLTLVGVTSIQQGDFIFRTALNGLSGADVISGTSHSDVISGLAGNDILKGLEGDDQLDGGLGRDIADYNDATGGISVAMATGIVIGDPSVGNDTLRSVESVRGTEFDDVYVAVGFNQTSLNNAQDIPIQSTINNTFEGGGGNDFIAGSSGAQTSYSTGNGGTQVSYAHALGAVIVDLRGGSAQGVAANDAAHVGVDTIQFVNGVAGSNFNDTLLGTDSAPHVDVFYGGMGNDTIDGRDGYDHVGYYNFFDPSLITGSVSVNLAAGIVTGDTSVGTDTLRSVELVRGTQFNDTYSAVGFGAAGALNVSNTGTFNHFEGMGGNDTVFGNGNTRIDYNLALAAVTIDFQLGTARSTVADDAGIGIDTMDSGVNSARGSSFNDSLLGSNRNEHLLGGRGDDLLDGRNGFDRAVYSTSADDHLTAGISINLAAGSVQGDASVGNDTLRSIEGITGGDFADTFVATGYGLAGALNVGNNGSFNEIEGGGGNDGITGNGNTRIVFYAALAGVTVDLSAGTSRGTAAGDVAKVGTDTFTGVNAVAGSAFDDVIAGTNNTANTSEEFAGRAGEDHIDGLGGFDRAFYNNDASALSGIDVNLAFGIVTGDAAIGTDTLRAVEGIRGTNFADTYNAANFGAAGFLDAFVNNVGSFGSFNEFEGMSGNDNIVGNGNTRVAFYNASDGVTVDLAAGTSSGTVAGDLAGVGTDSVTGVNAVRGSGFGDFIFGNAGDNTLDGQGGNDTIQGRGGADTLIGGGGADRFVFSAVSDSTAASSDTISDFVHGTDSIDTLALSGVTSVQGLISGATQVAAHSIVWIQSGANTIVYMNNSATAQDQSAADMKIILTGVTASTLTSVDFFHF